MGQGRTPADSSGCKGCWKEEGIMLLPVPIANRTGIWGTQVRTESVRGDLKKPEFHYLEKGEKFIYFCMSFCLSSLPCLRYFEEGWTLDANSAQALPQHGGIPADPCCFFHGKKKKREGPQFRQESFIHLHF